MSDVSGANVTVGDSLAAVDPEVLAGVRRSLQVVPGRIDIWSYALHGSDDCLQWCTQWLSREEREIASRFVFARDRSAYIFAHGVLRHLLSLYCGCAAAELTFSHGERGKPLLQNPSASGAVISFNLSHSHGRALVAVGTGQDLGVDIEQVRQEVEALSIAQNYFFGEELQAIRAAPEASRQDAFFRFWVAKEAVLKARGLGLGFPLDQFRVRFTSDGESADVHSLQPTTLPTDLHVKMLPVGPGWFGAMATRGLDWRWQLAMDEQLSEPDASSLTTAGSARYTSAR